MKYEGLKDCFYTNGTGLRACVDAELNYLAHMNKSGYFQPMFPSPPSSCCALGLSKDYVDRWSSN